MAFPISGARAVVTGAGSGLGRAFCIELARRGARVVAADIDLEAARATAKQLDGEAHPFACDVAKREEVDALAVEAEKRLGGVDLVVNNAGVAVGGAIGDIPIDDWRWIVVVNLWGPIHGCHVFSPRLKRQGFGHVINVASAAGLLSPPMLGPYNATKAAVIALSETLSAELRASGVGVTVLCPTFFPTNIHRSARAPGAEGELEIVDKMMERSKFTADDVARIALDAAQSGELYVVPQADGRWLWRVKRVLPTGFNRLATLALNFRRKKA